MLELKGKYNTAKVYTDNVDRESISQVIELLNQEYIEDSNIRIMPDCHAGAGCVIGTTMTIKDKVCPNLVGVDIGCSVSAYKIKEKSVDLKKLDEVVNKYIPSGFSVHEEPIASSNADKIIAPVNIELAMRSLGTLGGGNHFLELSKDDSGNFWLIIHTGSRHLGLEVAKYYMERAQKKLNKENTKDEIEKVVAELKAHGRQKDIEKAIKEIVKRKPKLPKDLSYVYGKDFENYIHDMHIVQLHAAINHRTIAEIIEEKMDWHIVESVTTMHNYIDVENGILRKGAVSAQTGEKLVIPMNMRDGTLLCVGKGNPDWNFSAPHGAGRILSRSQAKDAVSMEEFKESMEGIYSTSVMESTIDEAPMVYKPIEEILENIKDTVDVMAVLKPVYNFKAH